MVADWVGEVGKWNGKDVQRGYRRLQRAVPLKVTGKGEEEGVLVAAGLWSDALMFV